MYLRRVAPAMVTAALFVIAGCGTPAPNPTPEITALFPSEITARSQAFTLFVSGTQFQSNSTVQWNGSNRPTVFNEGTTELAASITAADVQSAGVAQITVTTPAPGGGTSVAATFTINSANNGGPTITSLSPNSAALNGPAFTLTVNGTNFASSDYVTWEGNLRTTTFVSATQLTAQILSTDLQQQITASVSVHTAQLGVASPAVGFQVGSSTNASARFPQVISVSSAGGPADGRSSSPAMSADGRYVAFDSEAKNLVASAAEGNIFVRDTCVGAAGNCTPRTVAVDLAPDGSAPNDIATSLDISANGRYVAFASRATNLLSTLLDQHASRVFVRDLCVGSSAPANCAPHTELVSLSNSGQPVDANGPVISADGRFVAFTSPGRGLVPGGTATADFIFVRDRCSGSTASGSCKPQTLLASTDEEAPIRVGGSSRPSISQDGRYIAFTGVPATPSRRQPQTPVQIFLRDTCAGANPSDACDASTVVVSASSDGSLANGNSASPSVSADGRFVVFESAASNLTFDSANREDIFLRDTCVGPTAPFDCVPSTIRISDSPALSGQYVQNYSPSISPSGRYITYAAQSLRDSPLDRSGIGNLVLYDTCLGAKTSCSPGEMAISMADGSPITLNFGNEDHPRVPLTPDARFVAFFTSQAVSPTVNSGLGDVFLTTTPFGP
jgi:Tol biopolymer transport system component